MQTARERIWHSWLANRSVSTDSRHVKEGNLFFALKGDKFNGNLYAEDAFKSGAALAIVDEEIPGFQIHPQFVWVENALQELQILATNWRKTFKIPVLGISGSNGKTTTKELVKSVLSTQFKVQATAGNLNNHIGVPLTLLQIDEDTEIAVIELGANKPGEIAEVSSFALPTHGLMTNVGFTHLDGMISLDGVEKTEGELYQFLKRNNGTGFVFEGDERVLRQAVGLANQITYGGKNSDFRIASHQETGSGISIEIKLKVAENKLFLESPMTGRHNAINILAATAVGEYFGISRENIAKAIKEYVPVNNRSQWMEKAGKTILLDAYNANPSSMQASVDAFMERNPEKPALILGDMFELGEMSPALHREMGIYLNRFNSLEKIIFIGPEMKLASNQCLRKKVWYPTTDEAHENISSDLAGIKTVLIKGSRGMALEKLLENLN